jgi:hypothetical protein
MFFYPVFIQKIGRPLAFFLSSSDKNCDKAFAVLSKENDVALERHLGVGV